MKKRLIDANEIVKVAEHAYKEWNLAMAAADGRKQINHVYKMQELCNAVKAVANAAPTVDAVVLPCKCGDTVYDIFEAFHNGGDEINEYPVVRVCVDIDRLGRGRLVLADVIIPLDDFGETAFLSKSEAEAALKRRCNNEQDIPDNFKR